MLIKVARQIGSDNFSIFGQESNGSTWALCKMNLFLHGMDGARIEWCDTINSPRLVEDSGLMKFDIVVANPPFSLDKWGAENWHVDRYRRQLRGTPPKSKGDYAFILHMIEAAVTDTGRVGVIVPHGVLFRAGSEGKIRKHLVEENLLDAVIGLPPNLFYGTGIPAAILLFNRGRTTTDVLFVDASRDFEDRTSQNRLRNGDISRICDAFRAYNSSERYAHRATQSEIEKNEFNLNIPRYIDTFVHQPEVDLPALVKQIHQVEAELARTRKLVNDQLHDLGLVVIEERK